MKDYLTDATRWAAVVARDPAADRVFLYAVKTTKVFCRPCCKARLARRHNVVFYDTTAAATAAGFRACKRCKPDHLGAMPEEEAVRKVRALLRELGEAGAFQPGEPVCVESLAKMAERTGLSKWHFHRIFKKVAGVTLGEYARSVREGGSSSAGTAAVTPLDTPGLGTVPDVPWADCWDGELAPPDLLLWPDFALFERLGDIEGFALTDRTTVSYSIRPLTRGFLLVALDGGSVGMVQQAESSGLLALALEDKYPSALFAHQPMIDGDGSADDRRVRSIHDAIEGNV